MYDLASSETDEPTVSALGWFDENAVYDDSEPEDPDPTLGAVWLDLCKEQHEREGAVKSYRKGDASSQLVFSEEKSNYSLGVERLVWVDGYRQTTRDGEHKEPMTLVVLRLTFEKNRNGSDNKIRSAEAELRFQSDQKKDPDPEVVAWGPFRRPETWNVSKSQRKINLKADFSITGGQAGQQLSSGLAREKETSWDQTDFDQGTSTRVYSESKVSSTPHGVRWNLQENQLYRTGITPEVRVAVLLSRKQPLQPYRATFRIAVRAGTRSTLKNKSQSLLGLPVGKPIRWLAEPKPGNKDGCFNEGCEIVKHIDTDNLGALVRDPSDSTNLNPSWLNTRERFEVPRSEVAPGATDDTEVDSAAAADPQTQEDEAVVMDHSTGSFLQRSPNSLPCVTRPVAAGLPAHAQSHAHAPTRAAASGPAGPRSVAPIGTYSEPSMFLPPPGVDHQGYNRLVSLEARAAQAETRLAAQDVLIFRLQKALAEVEQIVSAG